MSKFYSYLNSSAALLKAYPGTTPFAVFLKKFFSANKKYGSKDRKMIAHLCYCYFRLGKALSEMPREEKILAGLFFCSTRPTEILGELKPAWNEKVNATVEEKCSMINVQFSTLNPFPWLNELSAGIDKKQFEFSHFQQPGLFLRLRPGHEKKVRDKLHDAGISFTPISTNCLSLPNSTKIETAIDLDKEAVVQDLNSQKIGEYYKSAIANRKSKITAWDCCAASGGKSLLLYDIDPAVELTVSDIRESILVNLKKRFQKAGIKKYRSFVIDLAKDNVQHSTLNTQFSMIIADVPCTGSGTWARTPEQLYFFEESKIDHYANLQKNIVSNTIPHLGKDGYFVYSTCSVFKKENEDAVEFIKQRFHLELVEMELLKGYDKKADTLFAALFKNAG